MSQQKMFVVPAGKTLEESPEVQQQIDKAVADGWTMAGTGRGGDGRILLFYNPPTGRQNEESDDKKRR